MTTNLKVATTNKIKIEKGVPMPNGTGKKGAGIYPWASMEIGDSFAVPPEVQTHFGSQATAAGRYYGRKFSVRKTHDGYRCWRIA